MFKKLSVFFAFIINADFFFKECDQYILYDYKNEGEVQFVIYFGWRNPLFDVWFNGYDQKVSILKVTFERYDHHSNLPAW